MVTGIALLGSFYLFSMSLGVALLDEDDDWEDDDNGDGTVDPWEEDDGCRYCGEIAPWLFVPVVGPFIAMSETPNDFGLWLLGMLQTASLGLTIGGIVRYKNTKRAAEAQNFTHWKLPGNRELALDVSASSRFSGPRLKLSF